MPPEHIHSSNAGEQSSPSVSRIAYLIGVLSIVVAAWSYPKWTNPNTEATLSWDVAGYYYYLPAFFIYQDARQLEFRDSITQRYAPSGSFYQAFRHEAGGNFVMKYSIGQAVLMSPGFFAGHGYALISDYPPDGFSRPYQAGVHWWSLLVAFIGLWYLRKILRHYFDEWPTALTLLFLTVGTNYLNYAAFDSAMTHNYLFTGYALLVWTTIRWHRRPSYAGAARIGLLIGLMALTRPPEIIAALLPLLWGIEPSLAGLRDRLKFLGIHFKKLALAAALVLLIGSTQIAYWLYATGEPIVYSYQDQGFDWLRPHLADVLWSYRKGWLLYTPLMVFAIIGLFNLYRQRRLLILPVLAFSVINFYIVSAWSIWWYGGSFGQRAMVQSYVVWALPLAAFIRWVLQRQWRWWVAFPLMSFCLALNIFHTRGPLDPEVMNRAYYWHTFFNFNVTPEDRLLLDSNTLQLDEDQTRRRIFASDLEEFDPDSTRAVRLGDGNTIFSAGPNLEFSPNIEVPGSEVTGASYLRAGARFRMPRLEYFYWTMPQFVVEFIREGQSVGRYMIRPARALKPNIWKELRLDVPITDESFDFLRIYLWNAGGTRILQADNIYVEVVE